METPGEGWQPDTSMHAGYATEFTPEIRAYVEAMATQIVWAATGRRFGLHEWTVRPSVPRTLPAYMSFPAAYDPAGLGGQWAWSLISVPGGNDVVFGGGINDINGFWLSSRAQIPLPGPVDSVSRVTIDGQDLNADAYRLDLGNQLVRQDGLEWPTAQDITKPLGSPNTWSVTYKRGEAVPTIVNKAAGRYAVELAKAAKGEDNALPARVTSINRQGVNVQLLDITDYLNKGLTGVQEVDQIILSINPNNLRARPRVVSLDMPTYR